MKTEAAILVELGKPLEIVELDIPALKPGQMLVEVSYSGVCHTQVLECRGYRGQDPFLPHCMGHEGSGTVIDVGQGVNKVKPGDKVILSWIKGSGADVPGTQYQWGERKVNAGGITTFSRHSVISENRLTLLSDDIPMHMAALFGCAVPTGVGAVLNTLQAKPGQSIAIFGVGGVGLCAVAGAVISGCNPIIAIDMLKSKLEIARNMGATHTIDVSSQDPVSQISNLTKSGVDLAVEATGSPQVIVQALECLRNQGGTAVVIGNARHGEKVEIDPKVFNQGKRLLGTWGGDSRPDRDYPHYVKLFKDGSLNLKPLVSKIYSLAEINKGIDDLESGMKIRPIINMSLK